MTKRVEIPLKRVEKLDGKLYCFNLNRAVRSVVDLEVTVSGYAEDFSDGEKGSRSNPYCGKAVVFLGDGWAGGKRVVIVVEGEDAEEAARRMRAALHRVPPDLSSISFPTPGQTPEQAAIQRAISENMRRLEAQDRLTMAQQRTLAIRKHGELSRRIQRGA